MAISMQAGHPALFTHRPARSAAAACRAAPVRKTAAPATRGLGRALGAGGRFALALVPFSFLTWIFVAN